MPAISHELRKKTFAKQSSRSDFVCVFSLKNRDSVFWFLNPQRFPSKVPSGSRFRLGSFIPLGWGIPSGRTSLRYQDCNLGIEDFLGPSEGPNASGQKQISFVFQPIPTSPFAFTIAYRRHSHALRYL